MNTILLIDDDEVCREPAAALLKRENWNVIEASDGEEGLAMAMRHRPAVILCDLLMPRVNGYQVCRAVREHVELRHTKVIVVTGRDYAADRKSAEEAGADGYLVKPLEIAKLMGVLDGLIPDLNKAGDDTPPAPAPEASGSGTVIHFWGVRGSIPSPGPSTVYYGGNTSCVEVRTGGQTFVLDAGSGIRPLGLDLLRRAQGAPVDLTLLLTHTHWDHIQGFPFFAPAYDPRNSVQIFGYEGALSGLRTALAGQMETAYFPVALDDMPSHLRIEELRDMAFDVRGMPIETTFTNHPGICVAYKLRTPDGVVVYMPDNETRKATLGADGRKLPDTSEENIAAFIAGADVVMMDSQYTIDEYQTHVGWGHGCLDEVVRMASAAKVKSLFLFHHDPNHDDAFVKAMVEHAKRLLQTSGSSMQVEAAREGLEVTLRSGVVTAGA